MADLVIPLVFSLMICGCAACQYFIQKEISLRQLGQYLIGVSLTMTGNYYIVHHHDNGWMIFAGLLIIFTTFFDKLKHNPHTRK